MLETLARIIIAASIMIILFFAYMKKDKLSRHVAYVILAAMALSMGLSGLANLFGEIEMLSFLSDFFSLLSGVVILVEMGLIIFLLVMRFSTKIMLLKVSIIVYVVLSLLIEFNAF